MVGFAGWPRRRAEQRVGAVIKSSSHRRQSRLQPRRQTPDRMYMHCGVWRERPQLPRGVSSPASRLVAGMRASGWLAGQDIVGVPVLGAAVSLAVTFGFVQFEDLQAVQEPGDLGPVLEGHAGVCGPAVAGTEQLPGEDCAGQKRAAYLLPEGREPGGRAEGQAEPGMDQVRGRENGVGERGAEKADAPYAGGRD